MGKWGDGEMGDGAQGGSPLLPLPLSPRLSSPRAFSATTPYTLTPTPSISGLGVKENLSCAQKDWPLALGVKLDSL